MSAQRDMGQDALVGEGSAVVVAKEVVWARDGEEVGELWWWWWLWLWWPGVAAARRGARLRRRMEAEESMAGWLVKLAVVVF